MKSETEQTWPLEEWPTDPSEILERLQTLEFTPGSQLFGNFFFRKYIWELTQLQKIKQQWSGGIDESDWLSRVDLIREHLQLIARSGIKVGVGLAPSKSLRWRDLMGCTDTRLKLDGDTIEVHLPGNTNFPLAYGCVTSQQPTN